MRAYTSLAALAIAAAAAATSCTLLVQFHDASETACDGGFCAQQDGTIPEEEDAPSTDETGVEAGAHDAKTADVVDAGVADHYAPCGNGGGDGAPLASGFYCGKDGLFGYAGPPSDLVQCNGSGGISKVTSCDGGCLPLPSPFPDACNPCPGHGDGLYCGRDLPGFPATNADFLIQCQSGNVVQSVACLHGCDSSGTASSCYP